MARTFWLGSVAFGIGLLLSARASAQWGTTVVSGEKDIGQPQLTRLGDDFALGYVEAFGDDYTGNGIHVAVLDSGIG